MINIVLFQPEIPENTGNIARSCVAFNARLHLIRPYGFIMSNAHLKRSGCDYWDELNLSQYDCFEDFMEKNHKPNLYIYTRYGDKKPHEINYQKNQDQDIWIMFGKESTGVPKEILQQFSENLIRVPTTDKVRSINLSNTVAIALYEVVKQLDYHGLSTLEPHKKDFWD